MKKILILASRDDGLGPELIINGGFDGNANNWTLNQAVYNNNAVDIATSAAIIPLRQSPDLIAVAGKTYRVYFEISNYSGTGSLRVELGGTFSGFFFGDGPKEVIITATSTSVFVLRTGGTPFTGTIDNISVREIL